MKVPQITRRLGIMMNKAEFRVSLSRFRVQPLALRAEASVSEQSLSFYDEEKNEAEVKPEVDYQSTAH